MALALTIGVAGAFATSNSHKMLLNPNWQSTDASGNVIPTSSGGMYDANKTVSQAQSDFGCSALSTPCAVTVTGENGPKTPNPTFIYRD